MINSKSVNMLHDYAGKRHFNRTPEPSPQDAEAGRKPFLLRLPPALMEDLRSWAAHDLRSLNGHIEFLLREAVRARRGKKEGR